MYGWYVDGFIVGEVIEANDEYIALEYWVPVDPETVCLVEEARDEAENKDIYFGGLSEILKAIE